MSKADKKLKTESKSKPLFPVQPWNCVYKNDQWLIEAYVEALGDWVTIAKIPSGAYDAEKIASFIVHVVNDHQAKQDLMAEMRDTIKLFMTCTGLTWEAEQAADIVLKRIGKILPPPDEPKKKKPR